MRNPTAWMTMDTPPKEEDGTVLVWAEDMPVSVGCCEDGYYVFTECEDLHNYFEGNEAWLTEHWTLWMHLPDPSGKNQLGDTHRVVPVELLRRAIGREDRMEMVTAFVEIGAIIEDKP